MEHGADEAPTPRVIKMLERRVIQRRRRKVEPSEALLLMVADEGEGGGQAELSQRGAMEGVAADVGESDREDAHGQPRTASKGTRANHLKSCWENDGGDCITVRKGKIADGGKRGREVDLGESMEPMESVRINDCHGGGQGQLLE